MDVAKQHLVEGSQQRRANICHGRACQAVTQSRSYTQHQLMDIWERKEQADESLCAEPIKQWLRDSLDQRLCLQRGGSQTPGQLFSMDAFNVLNKGKRRKKGKGKDYPYETGYGSRKRKNLLGSS